MAISGAKHRRWYLIWIPIMLLLQVIHAERLPIKIYTSADGLGSSFVDGLMRDSRGFMWFCTRDGLSRFDGAHFVTYQIGNNPVPPAIESIYQTRDGTYWVNTSEGTYRFNEQTVSQLGLQTPRIDAELVSKQSGVLLQDTKGTIWAGFNGISRLEIRDGKVEFRKFELNLPRYPDRSFGVNGIDESPDGSIWFETSWGIVRKLPDDRIVYYPDDVTLEFGGSSNRGGTSLTTAKDGTVWATFGMRIFVIKPETIDELTKTENVIIKSLQPVKTVELKADQRIELPEKPGEVFELINEEYVGKWSSKRSFCGSDGVIWIAAESGLLRFENGKVSFYSESVGLPNVLSHMEEDAAGNLWIAGATGLARLDRHGLVTFNSSDGLHSNRVFAINEAGDGTLYFATRDAYINRFNGKSFTHVRPAIKPNTFFLWTSRYSYRASNRDWWILSVSKLYRFSGVSDFSELNEKKPTAIYSSLNGLRSDGIFQILEDSLKNIWVSTRGADSQRHGLSVLRHGTEDFYTFTETDGYPKGKSVGSFAEDSYGNIWLGFYEGGLARIADGKIKVIADDDITNSKAMTDILFDDKGRLWLATAGRGIWRIDDPNSEQLSPVNLTTNDGLSSNNVRTITKDNFGRIYFGTVRGVDRLSPESNLIKHFTVNDGLASDFVQDSHCDKQGNLWFATNDGVSRLIPRVDETVSAPSIWIDRLRIAGEDHPVSTLGSLTVEKGDLTSNQNSLVVDFLGIDSRAGESLRYQYMLEGADNDWSAPTALNTVTYGNLQPATYRFLVRAVNSEGVVSQNPAAVSFRILPPIWRRWWFIGLCLLIAGSTAVAFYRYRVARLRDVNRALSEAKMAEEKLSESRQERLTELERVRSRIATDLHDDIGASLTQINILSEVAKTQIGENGKKAESLEKISDVSNELVSAMSDIVWAINPTKDHLSDLSQRMRRFASDTLSPIGITVKLSVPPVDTDISLGTNVRREVFLIFKEAVNNMAKYSEAKKAVVEMAVSDGKLRLTIEDDGKGFDMERADDNAATMRGGNGINNIKRRASEMGGELRIISASGQGTTINLSLPLDGAAAAAHVGGDTPAKTD